MEYCVYVRHFRARMIRKVSCRPLYLWNLAFLLSIERVLLNSLCVAFVESVVILGQGVIELIKILLSGNDIESNPEAVFTLLAFLYCCVQFDSIKVTPLFPLIHPSSPFLSSKTSCFFIVVVPPPSATFTPKCTFLSF